MLIFNVFFALKAETLMQHYVQRFYFFFLVAFVLLITAIGSSLIQTFNDLINNPTGIFMLLAQTLPTATHFYLNYFPVQWSTHALGALRQVNLIKYIAYSKIYGTEKAKELAEPEDQDYYGMGSRSARFTLLLIIGLVFSTLSPLITIVCFINFGLCRIIYGYLFCFAETRKSELGGNFFYTQLKHTQAGLYLYVLVMTGCLYERAKSIIPSIICATSFAFLIRASLKFKHDGRWESLEFRELDTEGYMKRASTRNYKQPELLTRSEATDTVRQASAGLQEAMAALHSRLTQTESAGTDRKQRSFC